MTAGLFKNLVDRFTALEAELNRLDAATGDGDHGTTMLRGLVAAAAADGEAGKAFRRAAGGASGSLFGLLIGAIEQTMTTDTPLDLALDQAASRVAEMGQAVAGDKTMLDALIPAARAGARPGDAAVAARHGAIRTQSMIARRGRSKYVEGAGVGHLDPGAVSVAEILETFAAWQGAANEKAV